MEIKVFRRTKCLADKFCWTKGIFAFAVRWNISAIYASAVTKFFFRFFYELEGCLLVFPPAEDNYGVDSCDILCFPTSPVVIAIISRSGVVYHCIVLDSEEEDVFSKPFVSKMSAMSKPDRKRVLVDNIIYRPVNDRRSMFNRKTFIQKYFGFDDYEWGTFE